MQHLKDSRSEGGLPTVTFAIVLALGLVMSPSTSHSTISVRDLCAPDGEVRAIARANNTLYLGGTFSHVGPVSGRAVALDLSTAVAQAPYPKVGHSYDSPGSVYAVEPDGSGGWYIGGHFIWVQGQRRINLAHIDAAGQVTSWNPWVNGDVFDIAVSGGVVYVIGEFTDVGTVAGFSSVVGRVRRFGAAAINAATGVATHWNPDPDSRATEVEVGGGKVYLGGSFRTIYSSTSPEPRPGLAEFTEVVPGDPSTGALTGLFAGSDPNLQSISALELTDGKLFFAAATFTPEFYLKIYDLTAGSFLPYTVTADGLIDDVALDEANGTYFIGGTFGNVGGFLVPGPLVALNLATGNFIGYISVDGPVRTLTLTANALLVGGFFSTLGGTPRRGLGLVDLVSGTVLGWDAGLLGNVHAVETDGARVFVGGDFSIVNSSPRTNLAAIDEISGALLPWSPTTNATVEALMASGSTVYIGGQFSTVNGTLRNRAAAVNGVTGALTAFNPNVDGLGPVTVKTFAIAGSTVYLGGAFEAVRGADHVGIAAVNASTGAVSAWDPGVGGAVNAITYIPAGIFGGAILVVGGDFTNIGGLLRPYVATIDPATGASFALDSPNGPVLSMFVEPTGGGGFNLIYIGGAFTTVAGQPRNHIASLAAFGLVTSWNPNANALVYSITKLGNTAFVGGTFTTIGGQTRFGIAAIDDNGVPTLWDPQWAGGVPTGGVTSVLEGAGTLYAGGTFVTIAESPHCNFAGMAEIVTAVKNDPVPVVTPLAIRATPNPFDQSTKIQFSLAKEGAARVTVYDVAGRRVREIHSGWLSSGRHTMSWDGREESGKPVAAGVYFIGIRSQAGYLGSKVYRVK